MNFLEIKQLLIDLKRQNFDDIALEIFKYQSKHCFIYNQFLNYLNFDTNIVKKIEDIPFLPIEFFKNHIVKTNEYNSEKIFESSNTNGLNVSNHHVKDLKHYENSFTNCFNQSFLGNFKNYVHLALLPSYLERNNSSLIYQINYFIENSNHQKSSFYLNNIQELYDTLIQLNEEKKPVVLWGVTYALLDFSEKYKANLSQTILIETGGMKGRRKEITKQEFYEIINNSFAFKNIASEYGMTELMSQCYSQNNNQFLESNSVKVLVKEINDPFKLNKLNKTGVIHIIDLNNIDSCCFIATSDLGIKRNNEVFEVIGRLDFSDMRGCNLLL